MEKVLTMPRISALIITHNEAKKIKACLESISWADEIIVVDAESTDETVGICKEYTNKVYLNPFKDFSGQKNFALSKAAFEWALFIDADEIVTPSLKKRIMSALKADTGLDGYFIRRSNYIFNKELRYGGHDKDFQLRLFKKEGAKFYQPIHEKVYIESKNTGYIEEPLLHYSTRNIDDYVRKLNLYTDLECEYMVSTDDKVSQARIFTVPFLRFIKRYIIQQGFLDGIEGFMFYLLSAFYDFLKYAKYFQRRKTGRLLA